MRITLVGTGCGTAATLTEEGRRAFERADVIIGAGRILEEIQDIFSEEQHECKSSSVPASAGTDILERLSGQLAECMPSSVPASAGTDVLGSLSELRAECMPSFETAAAATGIRDISSERQPERKVFITAKPNQVCDLLEDCYRQNHDINVAIALSGDSGFYSGARILKQKISERFCGKDESSIKTELFPEDAEYMQNQVAGGMHQAKEIEIEILPGISSVQMLAARLGIPWQDWNLVSAHGTACDPVFEIMKGRKTFFLTGGKYTADVICRELAEAGLGDLRVTVGENLSYLTKRNDASESALKGIVIESGKESHDVGLGRKRDNVSESALRGCTIERHLSGPGCRRGFGCERIITATAAECSQMSFSNLSVLLVDTESHLPRRTEYEIKIASDSRQEESAGGCSVREERLSRAYISAPRYGISDAEFIRGKVPMTKMEVRNIILGKLGVRDGDIIWDIGAGTGSVSIELAMRARQVWSLERNEEAIGLLHANREKFGRWNMHIVRGDAPGELEKLPTPARVFVGGSGGKLKDILSEVWERNDGARICVSAVLMETLWECTEAFEAHGICPDIVQVAVNRVEKTGGRHMMKAGNPVFIITGEKESGS